MTGKYKTMLEFLRRENTWSPPEIPEEMLFHYYKKVPDSYRDYLIMIRIEPYIDSMYVHYDDRISGYPVFSRRFVFHNGYVWDDEDERIFTDKCLNDPDCGYDYTAIDEIYKIYSKQYPEWNLTRYYTRPFRLLDHIYHCMRQGSAKEILYKAGLDELAANLETLDERNLLASRPSDLYDGLSTKSLRALNCREGAALLSAAYNRRFLKELQMRFPEIFKERLNDAQCSYLNHLIVGDLTVGEAGRLYKARSSSLKMMWNRNQIRMFLHKERNKEQANETVKQLARIDPIYGKYLKVHMDSAEDTDSRINQLKTYLLVEREEYTRQIRRANRRRKADWQDRGNGYVVRYPQTIHDFCREAVYMGNCLLTYVEPLKYGDTTILFMRKEDDVNTPFITLEVFNQELMQAYHRFNGECTEEEAEWIKEYCDRHGIGREKFFCDCVADG